MLRSEFYEGPKWEGTNSKTIFTSIGYPAPFKGLHVLINVIKQLKQKYPKIKLIIAGSQPVSGIRCDGYLNYIKKMINRYSLIENVEWKGHLNGSEIIKEVQIADVAVYPSFSESYGLAICECMAIGIPIVAAYNGGYSYLSKNSNALLFFSPGDVSMCAFQIAQFLDNPILAQTFSQKSIELANERNNPRTVLNKQLAIYNQLFYEENC
jgi:glycosyltransferase involved in cell wall biosynthesis